ncbi:MAG TPA: ChaN family lipoprotein, partial [Burkholderiaceae bacterium]|nr:ChaN family lipoprotein [Burkholderiaceae bacterium]
MLLLTSGLRAQTVSEAIWSTAAQRWVSYAELVQTLRAADLVFLGEQHDNQAHHETRARLVADLSRPGLTLVFEQLPAQGRFTIPPQEPDLLTVLRVQGFQEKAWAWPMHAPLFAVAQRLAIPLSGGNIQSGLGRRVYAEGPQALPIEIQQALASA